jgi:hypothetical protein
MSKASVEVMTSSSDSGPLQTERNFFTRNATPRREIIEGLIREQQLVAFAGPYGVGKSPVLADIVIHVLNGMVWCGRAVEKRPVIHFDLETPGPVYRANVRNTATRLNLSLPKVPEELDIYLEHDDRTELGTEKLFAALAEPRFKARFKLIEEALDAKPDALVIIDPLELLFRIDTTSKVYVLTLYAALRGLLSRHQCAAMLITFNLRKRDKKASPSDLLTDPRGWLEEVCGTLDILNRSDVRLGMDRYGEDARVINGIRRGEDMHPLIVRPIDIASDTYAGFELCPPDAATTCFLLTPGQRVYWDKLPKEFRFDEVADSLVPRSTLDRLLKRAKSAGLVEQVGGIWKKISIGGVKL